MSNREKKYVRNGTTRGSRSAYLTAAELGMANAVFVKIEADHAFWERADYEALAKFWCSDLSDRQKDLWWNRTSLWEVVTPNGKRVSCSLTRRGAWRLALVVIFDALVKKRKEQKNGNG